MQDLISIVVIVYNTEKFIKECLDSIINQTYKKLEIIIVNDGSKDNSEKIIKEYEKKDNRIKFINRKENKGTMYTRKEGYESTTGKYVTFVDSDDMLELETIEVMYNELKKNKCDIVKCEFSILKDNIKKNSNNFNSESKKFFTKDSFEPEFYDLIFKTIKMNTMCGMLIKREKLKDISKIDTSMIYGEDLSCNLYMYKNIKSILIIPNTFYVYRQNSNSITFTVDQKKLVKKIDDSIKTYLLLLDFIDLYKIKDKDRYIEYTKQKLKRYLTLFLIKYCYNESYNNFKEYVLKLFKDEKLKFLFKKNIKEYVIFNNKIINCAINLLFSKKYLAFYIYSKYIYKNLQKLKNIF